MNSAHIKYLKEQIENHLSLFFTKETIELYKQANIKFLPYAEALKVREKSIVIPTDIEANISPKDVYHADFNNTKLTLWNRLPEPADNEWALLNSDSSPLWYQHSSGTLMPTWNIFGNLIDLLTNREEREISKRDEHGRFSSLDSPRLSNHLLEVPAFNEAVAVLVGAVVGLHKNGVPKYNINSYLKPPVVVLSHDCDVLYGNDFWTQIVRLYRVFLPLKRFRLPKISNLWWILRNYLTPLRFYFDNVKGMIDIERNFGYKSTFYLINGTYGRFGTRSGIKGIKNLAQIVPIGWDLGMHYNYDTFLNKDKFQAQFKELQDALQTPVKAGRAHYLKIDSQKTFSFLADHKILVDESLGFAKRVGYRVGLGGCFKPFDFAQNTKIDLWEIPIIIMDATLVQQYQNKSIDKFRNMITHLSCLGGAISIVFHPGQFYNPEHHHMLGIYHKLLIECRNVGAESKTALTLMQEAKQ